MSAAISSHGNVTKDVVLYLNPEDLHAIGAERIDHLQSRRNDVPTTGLWVQVGVEEEIYVDSKSDIIALDEKSQAYFAYR